MSFQWLAYGTGKIYWLTLPSSDACDLDKTVDYGELFSGFLHAFLMSMLQFPGQSSSGVHGLYLHFFKAPHMHASYLRKGSKTLCSSDLNRSWEEGTFFYSLDVLNPSPFHASFFKPGRCPLSSCGLSSLFQPISTFFHKEPPCCIVVGVLFSEAWYFT